MREVNGNAGPLVGSWESLVSSQYKGKNSGRMKVLNMPDTLSELKTSTVETAFYFMF